MNFCPKDENKLVVNVFDGKLVYRCLNCGYSKEDTQGGLVRETLIGNRTSDAYKIILNEFTTKDPTLPTVKNIKCPNGGCTSNTGQSEPKVMFLLHDRNELKYCYICMRCNQQWRSR